LKTEEKDVKQEPVKLPPEKPVFGMHLNLLEKDERNIPKVLKAIIEYLELFGLEKVFFESLGVKKTLIFIAKNLILVRL